MSQSKTFEEYLREHKTGGGAVYHQIKVTGWVLDLPVIRICPMGWSGSADFMVDGNELKPVVKSVELKA